MLFGYDLKEIFMFPVKDDESRKHFYVGIVVALLAFIIPVIPYLILFGYGAQIAKQILNGELPRMVAWDDWGKLLKDGLKVFGVRLVTGLPVLIFIIPFILFTTIFPVAFANADSDALDTIIPIYVLGTFSGVFCCVLPISFILGIIAPAPEMYVIEKDDFTAAFRVREWWQIFRANLGGFLAAFGIYYIVTLALTFVAQILFTTLILACLTIVFIPATSLYITIIMYVFGAIAYKDGKGKLQNE